MKFLVLAAAAALLAPALPAAAQTYPSAYPSFAPPEYNGTGGPQWQWMSTHGYTTTDTLPYSGNDVFSDQLNNPGYGEFAPPPYPRPGPYYGPRY